MIVDANQRWNQGRHSWRPAGEIIKTSEYDVAPIHREVAKEFVLRHHYSGTFVAARFCYGLWRSRPDGAELSGVAAFSHPVSDRVLTKVFPVQDATEATELGRLVLLDGVPGNGESWFVARCFERLRQEGIVGVVSFSDPMPRRTAEGRLVLPGHLGTIYQALNGIFLGRGDARTLHLLPDGTNYNHRTEQKARRGEVGQDYAVRQLVRFGAELPSTDEDMAAWIKLWLDKITRRARHKGNFKYAWGLDRSMRRCLPASLPYPKTLDLETAA
jgi:hypothetical protein